MPSCEYIRLFALLTLSIVFMFVDHAIAKNVSVGIEPSRVAEIALMLPESPQGLTLKCSDRKAWSDPQLHRRLNAVKQQAGKYLTDSMPSWNDKDYLEFSMTGERRRGDTMQQRRKGWLMPLVIAECLEYKGRYLDHIETTINELIRQPTWVLPSSDLELTSYRGQKNFVELNAADLARDLGDSLYMLGDKLKIETRAATIAALERRIFAPMRTSFSTGTGHWWLSADSNWNPACHSGVTAAALTALQDKNDRALFAAAAEVFSRNYVLDGFADDGYAKEGVNYWNFGFGNYAQLRERLWQATRGKVDLFLLPKVNSIASFWDRFQMFPGNSAAFGDSILGVLPNPDLVYYLTHVFGFPERVAEVNLRSRGVLTLFPQQGSRLSLETTKSAELSSLRSYFENAGVLVARPGPGSKTRLAITIKAGGNSTHSHNDIGSYALAFEGEQPVGDPGGLKYYSRRSFGPQRNNSKVINSFGHPVPVVAGKLQRDATTVKARVLSKKFTARLDSILIDMAAAYDVDGVRRLERMMVYDRDGTGSVVIEDRFEFDSAKSFETAITTTGTWTRLDQNMIDFTKGDKKIHALIDASSTFEISSERVAENGVEFDRIAVRLKQSQKKGFVRVTFLP